jgi:predicted nucleic acid-binding protein
VSLILDASVTLSWYFEDERTPAADALLDQVSDTGAVVPVVWRLEVANGFQIAIRRKRVDADFRDRAIERLMLLPVTIDFDTDAFVWTTTLRLADRFGLSIYDASYLELARRRELPLATFDAALARAAHADNIRLIAVR